MTSRNLFSGSCRARTVCGCLVWSRQVAVSELQSMVRGRGSPSCGNVPCLVRKRKRWERREGRGKRREGRERERERERERVRDSLSLFYRRDSNLKQLVKPAFRSPTFFLFPFPFLSFPNRQRHGHHPRNTLDQSSPSLSHISLLVSP